MFVAKNIQSDHKDLIHDVSYDFHGRRMATCSSDQSVKVRTLSLTVGYKSQVRFDPPIIFLPIINFIFVIISKL